MFFNSPLKLAIASTFVAAIALITIQSCSEGTDASPTGETTSPALTLSPNIPVDDVDYSQDNDGVQQQLEDLSWRYFVALCWPANEHQSTPNTSLDIATAGDPTPVWQNFAMDYDVYLLPEGTARAPYGNWDARSDTRIGRWTTNCPELVSGNNDPELGYYPVLDEFIEAGLDGRPHYPLIDGSGEYIHTGVYYNKTVYDYVVNGSLYEERKLESMLADSALRSFRFEAEDDDTTFYYRLDVPDDGIMIKASWKLIDEHDDTTSFHTTMANLIFENHNLDLHDADSFQSTCEQKLVGLVGFHLVYKTPNNPYWVWSTFEHHNNAPFIDSIDPTHAYNFYNESDPTFDSLPVNHHPTANNIAPNNEDPQDTIIHYYFTPEPGQIQTQVARALAISTTVKALNSSYEKALGNSVWANYIQVGTQWTRDTAFLADEITEMYPDTLANTSLESFEQLEASCMGCHNQVSGLKNNDIQVDMGNHQYTPLARVIDSTTYADHKITKVLQSDFMWSSFKILISGHLTWRQIKAPE